MGYYVNPREGTKEAWLEANGQVTDTPSWPPPEDMVPVCLVDNGPFTAAGICYDEAEFDAFNGTDPTREEIADSEARAATQGIKTFSLDSGDQRPRKWFYVSIELLFDVEPRLMDRLS